MDPKWNLGSKKFFLPFTPHGNIWISVLSASSLAFRLQPVSEERNNSSYSCGCVTDQSSERGKQVCSNFKLISLQTGWLDQRKGLTLGKKTNLLRKHLSSIHGEALQRPQKPENPVGYQDNAEIIFPPTSFLILWSFFQCEELSFLWDVHSYRVVGKVTQRSARGHGNRSDGDWVPTHQLSLDNQSCLCSSFVSGER